MEREVMGGDEFPFGLGDRRLGGMDNDTQLHRTQYTT